MKRYSITKYKILKKLQVAYFFNFIKKRKINNLRYYIYLKFHKKKFSGMRGFFRVNVVQKPLIFRRKSKYCRYFLLRQFFRSFYGFLKIKHIKKIITRSKIKKMASLHFLKQLEWRLDVLLFRLGLFKTVKAAKIYILHYSVLVNSRPTKNFAHVLDINDFLSLAKEHIKFFKKKLYCNIRNKILPQPILANYLNFNYKTLTCMPNLFSFEQVSFPFRFQDTSLKSIMNYYYRGLL